MTRRQREDRAAPTLLIAIFAATLGMVIAVVLLLQVNSDWVDFLAIALLVVLTGFVLMLIASELREQPPGDDEYTADR
jgi:CHASE2 domain-containing sensor protein